MLEDADEGGMKLWHLVKPTEEPELPKHRRGSLRERERAKAIPEIYLTRLLSMKVRKSPQAQKISKQSSSPQIQPSLERQRLSVETFSQATPSSHV